MTSDEERKNSSEAETRIGAEASQPGSPLVGRNVGNFHVTAELGHGAFGNVYKATDTSLGRDVALKFLRNPLDSSVRTLFEREAKAIASLSKHPGIVDIYQWGEFEGQHYFALEFVDSNAERLLEENPDGLPLTTTLNLFAQCAEALASAHKAEILHRDIKPANILIDSATMSAKLADFGLARFRQSTEFTLNGLISGSPPYMSPEQAKGEPLDARSDIFSLGVSLYEMLCGQRPFEGDSIEDILSRVRGNLRTPFKMRRPDIHEGICHVVEKATAHNPAERFQSAADFARALRIALTALERSGSVPDSIVADAAAEKKAEQKASSRVPFIVVGLSIAAVALLLVGVTAVIALRFGFGAGGAETIASEEVVGGLVPERPRDVPPQRGGSQIIGFQPPSESEQEASPQPAISFRPVAESTDPGAEGTNAGGLVPNRPKNVIVQKGGDPSIKFQGGPPSTNERAPISTANSPVETLETFCTFWSKANFEGMYFLLSPSRKAGTTQADWTQAMGRDRQLVGLPASWEFEADGAEEGARTTWKATITFSNDQVGTLTKETQIIKEGSFYYIDLGGLGPLQRGGF